VGYRYKKHYTRDEARALLPQIRKWLERLGEGHSRVSELEQRLGAILAGGSDAGGDMVSQWLKTSVDLRETVMEFQRREIQIKDLARGLIDFPSIVGGREAFLCWEKDEEDIEFWHDLDSGYSGRERL
jgi:hypothetical protein